MRRKMIVLGVYLYDEKIGTLTQLAGDISLFSFDETYLNNPKPATLSLSFKDPTGNLITDHRPTKVRLPTFFSNLLPEGPLRTYLAEKAGIKEMREFLLLSMLGEDLPGAVTIKREDQGSIVNREEVLITSQTEPSQIMHFSLAGVQLKFSAVLAATGGLTIPAMGVGGAWIVKLPSLHFERVPENEYAMMKLAREMGMDVPEVKLVDVKDITGIPNDLSTLKGYAFAIERFDRNNDGSKVHIEDFAQIFGLYPEEKYRRGNYRNIATVIWEESGEIGIREFIKRLIFNILIGNADMHMKNWSVIYKDKYQASLAPAYDFVSTIPYMEDHNMALNLVKSKKFTDMSVEAFRYFAQKTNIPETIVLQEISETITQFQDVWPGAQKVLPLTTKMVTTINAHLKRLPLIN